MTSYGFRWERLSRHRMIIGARVCMWLSSGRVGIVFTVCGDWRWSEAWRDYTDFYLLFRTVSGL